MAKIGKYTKSAVERKRYTIDYSNWLDTGETVTAMAFATAPMDANPAQVDTFALLSGSLVQIFISGGLAGAITQYLIDVQMHTSAGQLKEDTITINCTG